VELLIEVFWEAKVAETHEGGFSQLRARGIGHPKIQPQRLRDPLAPADILRRSLAACP
jgi:hypothetical protein